MVEYKQCLATLRSPYIEIHIFFMNQEKRNAHKYYLLKE